MLAKLISLLLHAKAGVISGVFLIGATGALVSVSASNGVTTITITEPSPSPSASQSASPAPLVVNTPTPTPTTSPSPAAAVTPACTDEATAIAFQVQRVDSAFNGFHTGLEKLRGTRDESTLETADRLLKAIRQSATKAIHATATAACLKKDDDEDENDNDEDKAEDDDTAANTAAPAVASTLSVTGDKDNEEDNDGRGDNKLTVTFTGTASAIADQAIAAMQVAFDAANNAPAKTPKASATHKVESSNKGSGHDDGDHKGGDDGRD
jgi:hypothetical protein